MRFPPITYPLKNWLSSRPQRAATNYLVIHCSATPPTSDISALDIHKWHLSRGWQGIGYHFVINRSGAVESGESVDKRGAHVKGYNAESLGICMVGGVNSRNEPENNFTSYQWGALILLLGGLKEKYPLAKILGHRDLSEDLNRDGEITADEWMKACPSFDVNEYLSAIGFT